MAARIREMKTALAEQNAMITKIRADNQSTRNVITQLYTHLVKYKPEYQGTKTIMEEDISFPDIQGGDMSRFNSAELVEKMTAVIGSVIMSLKVVREEVQVLHHELDEDVEAEMAKWSQLRDQSSQQAKALAFRDASVSDATKKRSTTPDMVANHPRNGMPTLPPTPPEPAGTRPPVPQIATDKAKNGTTTLDALMSPKSDSAKKPTTTNDTKTKPSSGKK